MVGAPAGLDEVTPVAADPAGGMRGSTGGSPKLTRLRFVATAARERPARRGIFGAASIVGDGTSEVGAVSSAKAAVAKTIPAIRTAKRFSFRKPIRNPPRRLTDLGMPSSGQPVLSQVSPVEDRQIIPGPRRRAIPYSKRMRNRLVKGLPVVCFSLLAIVSCGSMPVGTRTPASVIVPPKLEGDLVAVARQIAAQARSPELTATNCGIYLDLLQDELSAFDIRKQDATKMKTVTAALTEGLWQIRLAFHDRLPELGNACWANIKTTFRKLRAAEEYLSETAYRIPHQDPAAKDFDFQAQPTPFLDRDSRYLVLTRKTNAPITFRRGDAMVARGVSFLSAMIARLGNIDSQFSHVILVADDPRDPKHALGTIESYVGEGVNFHEMHWALKNENARLLLLRPRDPKLAETAAVGMAKRVADLASHGKKIHYDYKLDFKHDETMSCAEVSQVAYRTASQGSIEIPEFPTVIHEGQNLLDNLAIKGGETFSPGDLEIDSRFELVAEFRDLRLTRDSRIKDAILTRMLAWMDQGYRIVPTTKAKMAAGPIRIARKTFLWPLVQKLIHADDFSKEIPGPMLKTVVMMNAIGEVLLNEAWQSDLAYERKTGWPMTYDQLYAMLDDYRARDAAIYANPATRNRAAFHKLFHP